MLNFILGLIVGVYATGVMWSYSCHARDHAEAAGMLDGWDDEAVADLVDPGRDTLDPIDAEVERFLAFMGRALLWPRDAYLAARTVVVVEWRRLRRDLPSEED